MTSSTPTTPKPRHAYPYFLLRFCAIEDEAAKAKILDRLIEMGKHIANQIRADNYERTTAVRRLYDIQSILRAWILEESYVPLARLDYKASIHLRYHGRERGHW